MLIKHKKGDSVVWECEYTDDVGVPVDLSTVAIDCKAVGNDGVVLFSVSSTDNTIDIHTPQSGLYRVVIEDTVLYVPKDYRVDIQYTVGSIVKSSETFTLRILNDVT